MSPPVALADALAERKATASSAYIARVGKNNIAFGLLWTLLPGVRSSGKEVRKLALDHKANAYVSLPTAAKQPMIGLLPTAALAEKGTSRRCSSAAALLALAYKGQITNAFFGFELPKGKVAVVGFREGMPLIGFDRVVSRDELDEVTAEFLGVLDKAASTATFFGAPGLFGARQAAEFYLNWFATAAAKSVSASRVRRAKPRIVLYTVIAGAIAAAWFGYGQYEDHQAQLKRAKAKQVVHDPDAAYKKSVEAYLGEAGYPVPFMAGPLSDILGRLPMNHQGWRYEGGKCIPGSCTLSWTNAYGGTFKSFASSPLPNIPAYKISYKEGMTGIETTFDTPIQSERGVNSKFLPSQEEFILNFGSTVQQLRKTGLVVALEKASIVGLPADAGSPPVTEEVLKAPIREGTWTLTGEWVLYNLLTTLPANMTIEGITLNGSGESWTMTVTGKYYVKN